jgi:hypothetical protein
MVTFVRFEGAPPVCVGLLALVVGALPSSSSSSPPQLANTMLASASAAKPAVRTHFIFK